MNELLRAPSTPWLISLSALVCAFALIRLSRRWPSSIRITALLGGSIFALLGLSMLTGAGAMMLRDQELERARPSDGKLVDLGGYRAFIRCKGPQNGHTILLLSGGYSNGTWMKPLQERLQVDHRACLLDRPGTGWADDGPLPRTVDRILSEIRLAVHGAGEKLPLVIIGHSMGGLYAANFADAYPADVRGIILLDPTPPLWFLEQTHTMGCGPVSPPGLNVYATMFGLGLVRALNPLYGASEFNAQALYGSDYAILADQEARPRSLVAAWSAGREACSSPMALVRTPGSLGTLPLLMITQQPKSDSDMLREAPPGLNLRQRNNWLRLRRAWQNDYVGFTSRGAIAHAPPGAGHSFPYSHLELTIAKIRPFLDSLEPEGNAAVEGLPRRKIARQPLTKI